MKVGGRRRALLRVVWLACGLGLAASASSGCYYLHLARGQAQLLWQREPLADVLRDPDLPAAERRALAQIPPLRDFAASLGLAVSGQYTSYVDWPGDRIVTTVVATPSGSVAPHPFHFPWVGALPYKGFFSEACARAEAQSLEREGFDTCLSAVPAYSTLGWIRDPVTAPMLRFGDGVLVEMLLHEWVHATVFARDHADFNEGIATFIGQEGAVRFFAARGGPARAARERDRIRDDRAFAVQLVALRDRIAALYREPDHPGRAARRAELEAAARVALAATPMRRHDPRQLSRRARLNDACLALAATYQSDLERYAERLAAWGGDLRLFVARARAAAHAADPRAVLLGADPGEGQTRGPPTGRAGGRPARGRPASRPRSATAPQ